MEIKDFWVVTTATKDSELVDVMFRTDIKKMALQFAGGLQTHEIIGLYTEEAEALIKAKDAMANPRIKTYPVQIDGKIRYCTIPED